jgi:hypothetical protein
MPHAGLIWLEMNNRNWRIRANSAGIYRSFRNFRAGSIVGTKEGRSF